jgi:hypothetical protein
LFVLMIAMPGCGPKSTLQLVPVSGKVTYRGRGVSRATVQLLADTAKGTEAPTATGQTDTDGSVTLQTPPHGTGVVPGHYRVTVQHYSSGIPTVYSNAAKTPLRVEVPPGGLTDWKLALPD